MPHGDAFELDCELCHAPEDWQVNPDKIKFDHNSTGYPLLGRHQQTECRHCHENLIFSFIGTACVDCHSDIHKGELGFRCQTCHTPRSWENRREVFEQHIEINFPLLGVHALLDCQSCHVSEQEREFVNLPVDCQGCHNDAYLATTNPDHRLAGFDRVCESCHLPNTPVWNQTIYLHPSGFPLEAGHANLDCIECHDRGFQGTINECYKCHRLDYENTSDPNHFTFGFPQTCENCHDASSWSTEFDHLSASGFALQGAHRTIQCNQCHVNNQITGLPRDCYGCHESDYQGSQDPNHVQANFAQNCLDCHSEDAWRPASFDHNLTAFPLTGAHIEIECIDCHIDGQYSGLPAECWSCHEADYLSVTDPNHSENNFSQNCAECHVTDRWALPDFDHNSATAIECIVCHQPEYDSTTDPNHIAAQFPIDCIQCHTTSAWRPASWDHDAQYFPIYTGTHREAWDNCSECHVNPANYTFFECINCKQHLQPEMDEKHREEPDYQFNSQECKTCHPDGRAEDGD